MTVEISCDADLPKCLNTASKQAAKARQIASLHVGVPAKRARGPRLQGFFSRTMIVTMQTGEEIVIQFRPEPLNMEPFVIARQALGSVVPEIGLLQDQELEDQGIWTYWMTCIPGRTWSEGAVGRGPETLVTINRSLGQVLSRGYVRKDSSERVVDDMLRPHLALLLSSEDTQISQFHHLARDLWNKSDRLKVLPLFVSHFDLNDVNIMIDDDGKVSGIVDWELSAPLPLGMGFSRIHTLAGEFSEQKFYMPPNFEDAERGFWQEISRGMSAQVRQIMDANLDAVQIAVTLGTLLDAFQLEEGKIGPYNQVAVDALPKLLTYCIPHLRGSHPPYGQ